MNLDCKKKKSFILEYLFFIYFIHFVSLYLFYFILFSFFILRRAEVLIYSNLPGNRFESIWPFLLHLVQAIVK